MAQRARRAHAAVGQGREQVQPTLQPGIALAPDRQPEGQSHTRCAACGACCAGRRGPGGEQRCGGASRTPVPRLLEPGEQLVQEHHLAGCDHQAGDHVVVAHRTQAVFLLQQAAAHA